MAFGGGGVGLLWDLAAVDHASPAFLRVAGAADKAATAAGRAQAKIATAGSKMSAVGSTLSKRLTLPLLAIGAVSVKAATDFNASMTRIQTQAGASAKDVQVLTKAVLGMKGVQQGPNALAGALYHLKSVGLDNAAAMKALRASSDLAAVGNANLEDTTNALAGAWRSGIKGAGSFAHTAATVNAIIGAGNMTLGDFTEGLSTGILPAARTFGVSLQSIGAALSVFTDEGVPANVALTRMRMTLSLLGAPTEKATKLLDGIGISSTQLAQDMRTGPNGLLNAVTDLKDHLSGLSKVAQAQFLSRAFGGGRSSSAIMTMLNQVGLLGKKWDQVTGSISKYGDAVKTQQATPQAQFKVALANLEKAGVLLGNQLLPIVIQFAHGITGLATGFNSLGSGTKHFITEVGIGLLLLGPMLSIVGKLAKGIALMWAAGRGAILFAQGMRAATLSTEAMTSSAYLAGRKFSGMGVAATRAASAVAGIGVGVSIGLMTRDSSQLTKGLGVLAATAAGLAIGGPLGALGGLVGSLAGAFAGGSQSAAAGAAELSAAVDGLTGTLNQNTGAVTKATKAWVAHDLATSGALDKLGALGLSYQTATAAAMGNKAAADQVRQAMFANLNPLDKNAVANARAAGEILKLGTALGLGTHQIKQQNAAQIALTQAHRDGVHAASRNADAVGNLAAGSHTAASAMHTETGAALNLTQSIQSITKSYLKMVGAELGAKMSELQFLDALHSMGQALKDSNGSLAEHTTKGRAAQEALLGLAQSAKDADNGTRKGNLALLDQIKTLRAHAIQAGGDKGEIDKLLGSMHLLPRQINMRLNLNTGASMQKLIDIQNQVNRMHGKTLFVGVAGGHTLGVATGGPVRGPGTSTSDSIPARLSNGEFVVRASQARKHQSLLNSINAGARGFAGGGPVGSPITTTQSGGKKVWVYKGIQYASRMAAENAKTRDEPAKKYRVSGPAGGTGPFDTRKQADKAMAHTVLLLSRTFDRMRRHDLPAFGKAIGKTGSDVKSAFSAWLDDAKELGLSAKQRHSLMREDAHIAHLVNIRNRDQARVNALRANRAAEKHTVAAAGRGVFDITSAGTNASGKGVSFGALNAQAIQSKNLVRKWAAGIRRLGKEGFNKSPTGLAMLRQLAEGGPADWPQVSALLSASPKQLAGLISTERSIDRTSGKLGKYVGGQLYDDRIRHERAQVHTDIGKLHDAAVKLEHRMERFENRPVEVTLTVDGRKLASATVKGDRRNGRRSGTTHTRPGGRP